jgi:hypothetical protein
LFHDTTIFLAKWSVHTFPRRGKRTDRVTVKRCDVVIFLVVLKRTTWPRKGILLPQPRACRHG